MNKGLSRHIEPLQQIIFEHFPPFLHWVKGARLKQFFVFRLMIRARIEGGPRVGSRNKEDFEKWITEQISKKSLI